MTGPKVIRVSAVVLERPDGAWVVVRKRGTRRFMNPGGKPEVGETAAECAVREVREELGLALDPAALVRVGAYVTETANEPDFELHSEVFRAGCPGAPEAAAEIDELRWIDPVELADSDDTALWAPLLLVLCRELGR